MLPKISTLIIGIIKEKPLNPYEINKFLEILNIKEWFPIAASSVYSTVRILSKKGYIIGETQRSGNMPNKVVYEITELGKQEFLKTLSDYLSSDELDAIAFNIASIFLCHLPKNTVYLLLQERCSKIEGQLEAIKMQQQKFFSKNIPLISTISLKHNQYLYEAELETTKEISSILKTDDTWDRFLTNYNS